MIASKKPCYRHNLGPQTLMSSAAFVPRAPCACRDGVQKVQGGTYLGQNTEFPLAA